MLAPLGFGHIRRALTVTFSCGVCQVLANTAAHTLPCRWCGPYCDSFDRRPGLRGPCTPFSLEAAALAVGQMVVAFFKVWLPFLEVGFTRRESKSPWLSRQDPTVKLLMFMGRFSFGRVGLVLDG